MLSLAINRLFRKIIPLQIRSSARNTKITRNTTRTSLHTCGYPRSSTWTRVPCTSSRSASSCGLKRIGFSRIWAIEWDSKPPPICRIGWMHQTETSSGHCLKKIPSVKTGSAMATGSTATKWISARLCPSLYRIETCRSGWRGTCACSSSSGTRRCLPSLSR